MRLSEPRIPPLPPEQWDEQIAPLADRMRTGPAKGVVNLFKTLANHPRALKRYITFANHIIRSSLPERDREILILRTGWNYKAEYEWAQHVVIGKEAGITPEEISRLKKSADAPGWSDKERLLIEAADQLHAEAFISDATWNGLAALYDTAQMMDIVLTVGNYGLIGMAMNAFGIQIDEGLVEFDGT